MDIMRGKFYGKPFRWRSEQSEEKLLILYIINKMPYVINKYKYGFRVCKASNPNECYSNKPLTKKVAIKQRTAINLSELRKQGKIK